MAKKRTKAYNITEHQIDLLVDYYLKGNSIVQTAKHFGFSASFVSIRLKKRGVTRARPGFPPKDDSISKEVSDAGLVPAARSTSNLSNSRDGLSMDDSMNTMTFEDESPTELPKEEAPASLSNSDSKSKEIPKVASADLDQIKSKRKIIKIPGRRA